MRSERSQRDGELVQYLFLAEFHRKQFVYANHEGADACIVRELFDVSRNLLDELVQRFQFLFVGGFIGYQIIIVTVVEQRPEFLDETVYTVDTVRIPGFGLFYGTEEHFVHTKCVRTIFFHNHIGIDDVEHGFAHLLDSPSADVFSVFQNKLRRFIFGTPCLERFRIENVVGYDVDIHMEWGSVVLVFQVQRYECIGILDAIYKVASSLNHTLVH